MIDPVIAAIFAMYLVVIVPMGAYGICIYTRR